MRDRVMWVDVARGIGIILVVFSHCWRGLNDTGLIADHALYYGVDTSLYLFHMPMFFFLSGVFFLRPIHVNGRVAFFTEKLFTIVYPYFLWSAILILLNSLTSSLLNKAFPLSVLWSLPVHPIGPFWFLYVLLCVQVIAFAVVILLRLSSMVAVCLGLLMLMASNFVEPFVIQLILFNFVFFALGISLAEHNGLRWVPPRSLAGAALVLYVAGLAVALPHGLEFDSPTLLPLTFLAITGVLATSSICASSAFASRFAWLATLGRASMAIYVMHVLFTAGTRIALLKVLGVVSVPVHLSAGLATGIVGPMIVYVALRRLQLEPLFGLAAPRLQRPRALLPAS